MDKVDRFESLPDDVKRKIDSFLLQEYSMWVLYIKTLNHSRNISIHLYGDD